MLELIALLTIVVGSLLTVRIGTLALIKTGLSPDAAAFQSQSAFMGVGFTTSEAESVVGHPVRRRIISLLMLLGFGAITSALGTVVVTFAKSNVDEVEPWKKLVGLLVGVLVLWSASRLQLVERLVDRGLTFLLQRWTGLKVVDYEAMLSLKKGYTIAYISVFEDSWMAGQTLRELALADEGILILTVVRENGVVIATPASTTTLLPEDRLLAYGIEESLDRLRTRPKRSGGDEHDAARRTQRLRLTEERTEDEIAEHIDEDASAS